MAARPKACRGARTARPSDCDCHADDGRRSPSHRGDIVHTSHLPAPPERRCKAPTNDRPREHLESRKSTASHTAASEVEFEIQAMAGTSGLWLITMSAIGEMPALTISFTHARRSASLPYFEFRLYLPLPRCGACARTAFCEDLGRGELLPRRAGPTAWSHLSAWVLPDPELPR